MRVLPWRRRRIFSLSLTCLFPSLNVTWFACPPFDAQYSLHISCFLFRIFLTPLWAYLIRLQLSCEVSVFFPPCSPFPRARNSGFFFFYPPVQSLSRSARCPVFFYLGSLRVPFRFLSDSPCYHRRPVFFFPVPPSLWSSTCFFFMPRTPLFFSGEVVTPHAQVLSQPLLPGPRFGYFLT